MAHDPLPQLGGGQVLGRWRLHSLLGRGGNGQVWRAQDGGGEKAALKILTKVKKVAYARFRDEVKVMKAAGLGGVAPVLDSYLPDDPTSERAWYAMPLGVRLGEHLRSAQLSGVVEAVADIADTLAQLHDRGIAHRDIKPANLLWINDRPVVADFGLVDYPEKDDLTGLREELGPRWTMAPEVRRSAKGTDALPADVYSLAKSLWVLVSGDEQGFEGQYNAGSSIGMSAFAPNAFTGPLDELVVQATEHDPHARPTMAGFATGLREWLRIQEEFSERNALEWMDVQRALFPLGVPERAIWTDLDDIVRVLQVVGQRPNLNHLFFPSGGGMDLEGAARSDREADCIELDVGTPALLKPKRLLFESFGRDPEWNYFRIETEELAATGVYGDENDDDRAVEEVLDLGIGEYVDRAHWDSGEYRESRIPRRSRLVVRYRRGAFVVFRKTSTYNRNPATYDARHNQMTTDDFRTYINRNVDPPDEGGSG